jgi:hypothetical protein
MVPGEIAPWHTQARQLLLEVEQLLQEAAATVVPEDMAGGGGPYKRIQEVAQLKAQPETEREITRWTWSSVGNRSDATGLSSCAMSIIQRLGVCVCQPTQPIPTIIIIIIGRK